MLRRIVSFVFLLLIGFTAQAQIFKVKIADEPGDNFYDLVLSYEGGDFYRFKLIGSGVVFNGIFELMSNTTTANGVVNQSYRSRTRIVVNTGKGYDYPEYATIFAKAYDQGMYRVIHFNFSFVYDKKTHILTNDLNLVCKK